MKKSTLDLPITEKFIPMPETKKSILPEVQLPKSNYHEIQNKFKKKL